MKPTIALVALFISACGGSADEPTEPIVPIIPQPVDGGEWGSRAGLVENNSEFALAEAKRGGKFVFVEYGRYA